MKHLAVLAIAAVAAISSPLAAAGVDAQGNPFLPATAPEGAHVTVKLDVHQGSGMMFVKGRVFGEECTLLWDTGCTHTTFDRAFMKRVTGSEGMPVQITGDTNVSQMPHIYNVDSLTLGEGENSVTFGPFMALSVDIGHMVGPVGSKVDGVLGMNVIGRTMTLMSAARGEVVFNPSMEACGGFGPVLRSLDPDSLLVPVKVGERAVPMLVDSGSSMSFLKEGLWESCGEENSFSAVDANGRTSMRQREGVEGFIDAGVKIPFKPLVVQEDRNYIGSDVLRRCDILLRRGIMAFRPLPRE